MTTFSWSSKFGGVFELIILLSDSTNWDSSSPINIVKQQSTLRYFASAIRKSSQPSPSLQAPTTTLTLHKAELTAQSFASAHFQQLALRVMQPGRAQCNMTIMGPQS
jgi:hypothetical protein